MSEGAKVACENIAVVTVTAVPRVALFYLGSCPQLGEAESPVLVLYMINEVSFKTPEAEGMISTAFHDDLGLQDAGQDCEWSRKSLSPKMSDLLLFNGPCLLLSIC